MIREYLEVEGVWESTLVTRETEDEDDVFIKDLYEREL